MSMYTKTINDRQVFSDCKVLHLENDHSSMGLVAGQWISNPSEELILAEGWEIYVPPTPPEPEYEPQTEPGFDEIIQAVKNMLAQDTEALSDEAALSVAALFPTFVSKIGQAVSVGERLWYDGKLYKVIQAHTIQDDWKPDTLPAMYTEISIVEIPEWVQPIGDTGLYMIGDKVTHNGHTWECTSNYNSYEPGVWGWNQID